MNVEIVVNKEENIVMFEVTPPQVPGGGEDGREVELRNSGTYIQWRYVGDTEWINLVALEDLKGADGNNGADGVDGVDGADGEDGREVQLQTNGTHIQWRYLGDISWTNLIPLSELKGDKGDTGDTGAAGADGADGREVELQSNGTHIRWRYAGDVSWNNLVALSSLKGDKGDTGDTGAAGADGSDGSDGADGKEVELQSNGTHIQWRYLGDVSWVNLVALSSLKGDKGDTGDTGAAGADGADGADGVGVPTGGSTGQVLKKKSATDYDTEWGDESGESSLTGTATRIPFFDGSGNPTEDSNLWYNAAASNGSVKVKLGDFSLINENGIHYSISSPSRLTLKSQEITFHNAGGNVGIKYGILHLGTSSPHSSAVLDVVSTTKGTMPFPRMTEAQKNAIASPGVGLHIYQTDGTEGVYVYKSGGWTFAY